MCKSDELNCATYLRQNPVDNVQSLSSETGIPNNTVDEKHDTAAKSEEQTTRKTVRFSEGPPLIVASGFHQIKDLHKKDYFWQESDYRRFLRTAALIAVEVRKLSKPRKPYDYEDVLTRILAACEEKMEMSHSEVHLNDHCDSTHWIPPDLFLALSNWVKAGSSRRGLEKLIIPNHAKSRNQTRQNTVSAVLEAQKSIQMCAEGEGLDKHILIRNASENCSRSARLFALVMGHADASAVSDQLC